MALPLIAAAAMLFYLSAVPVYVAFHWRSDAGFGLGISVFSSHSARKQAHRFRTKNTNARKPDPRRFLPPIKYLVKHMDSLHLDGTLGTSDAATTALLCGCVQSVGYAVSATSGRRVRLTLAPDFSTDHLHADLFGMICLRAGHIIFAALLGVFKHASGRIRQWTSTPSNVS